MSLFSDAVLPGSTRLHTAAVGTGSTKNVHRPLRKSQSHAGLLAPLVQLIRDPAKAIGGVTGAVRSECNSIYSAGSDPARTQVLQLRMRNAETHDDWISAATELDVLEGNDRWKAEDDSVEYDTVLVGARLEQLDEARISCDVKRMLFLIRTSLTRSLGGMGDLRLYKHSHIGTKRLIERYIESAQATLTALLEVAAKQGEKCPIEPRVLVEQLLHARQSFGRSALLLSGGGTFGMNHIGVVKCLWEARLLPRIISGASAGSIVCAVLCSRTDAEIPAVLEEFCYGDLAVFDKDGEEDGIMKKVVRFLKYGALFDISHLMNVMRSLLGDITFQESYNRTRRILNITVSSASLYELPRLLNYVTAPNVMIWSAVCASCSVPFVFSAASLLAKDPKTGKETPWNPNPNVGWIDGSVDNDLPMTRLAEMFNVNHFIVSQVNPHVVPFLVKEEEVISAEAQQASAVSAGPGWMHSIANLAKGEALHRLQVLSELGVFPNYVSKARSVLNQRYSGDITIFPSISYAHFPKVLSNPTTEYMLQSMLTGERATWPKLSRVQNHVAIELALDDAIRQARARVIFSPSQIDLRLHNLSRPLSQGNENLRTRFKTPAKGQRSQRGVLAFTAGAGTTPNSSRRLSRPRSTMRSSEVLRPYLPTHSDHHVKIPRGSGSTIAAFDAISSSTNNDGGSSDEDLSDANSDTSEFLSSPSPVHSPSSAMPELWPSTRQLFPYASQPTTPLKSSPLHGRSSSSLLNLSMTSTDAAHSKPPSSPELRYKRLFHPPPASGVPPSRDGRQGVSKTIPSSGLSLQATRQSESFAGEEAAPASSIFYSDSRPDASAASDQSAVVTPGSGTTPKRNVGKVSMRTPRGKWASSHTSPMAEEGIEAAGEGLTGSRSRRGSRESSWLGLHLDMSGTRGMMLRKKKKGST